MNKSRPKLNFSVNEVSKVYESNALREMDVVECRENYLCR